MSAISYSARIKNWLENDLSSVESIGMVLLLISSVFSFIFGQTAIAVIALAFIGPVGLVLAVWYCLKPVSLTDGEGKWFWNLGRAIVYFAGFGVIAAIFLKYVLLANLFAK